MRNGLTLYRKFDHSPFAGVLNDFEIIFDRALRDPLSHQNASENQATRSQPVEWFQPQVELDEAEHEFHLSLDLPGVKKEDLKIDLKDRILTVSGERRRQKPVEASAPKSGDKTSSSTEKTGSAAPDSAEKLSNHWSVKFERNFTLPETVNQEAITADLSDGVLKLVLPKRESLKPRTIQIGSSGGSSGQITA